MAGSMSAFARILRPIPASRRNYSFFSSKSGGGRYFNSAKPPKTIVPSSSASGATTAKANPKVDPAVDSKDVSSVASASNVTREEQRPSSGSDPSSGADTNPSSPQLRYPHALSSHPVVNPKDFKLHQFFSLHRPLLLLSNPSSILETASSMGPLFTQVPPHREPDSTGNEPSASTNSFEDFRDMSFDADAEAARQLTRALTMNRAGATFAWEDTLRRLGLDVNKDAERIGLQQQWDREWEEIRMDSVKRKRRKKMKKHKLKKRRKATRATRLKIGR